MFAVVSPRSLVLAPPAPLPPPQPWGSGSIRRTRCKLNRAEPRSASVPACPSLRAAPLPSLRAGSQSHSQSGSLCPLLRWRITAPPAPKSPGLPVLTHRRCPHPSVARPPPRRWASTGPWTAPSALASSALESAPSSLAPLVSVPAGSSAYTRAPESRSLKQTGLAPCFPPAATVVCCFF